MAGTSADFDADAFKEAIRAAMLMGMPNNVSERATFRWTTEKTFSLADPAGSPYDLTATPVTTTAHPDVQVPVAVEFVSRVSTTQFTAAGEFDQARAVITVLGDDYDQIEGADQVVLSGNTYDLIFVAPKMGLFDVDVVQIHALARDET